jgi:LuxR family maltose regulon positive regulatory protein
MRAAAAEAVALETDPASPWHALARVSYASALYLSGDFDVAAEQAQQTSPAGASAVIRVLGLAVLSLIAVDRGELDQAEQWARTAQEILASADPGLSAAPQSSLAFTAAGEVAARRGWLIEARWEFERALESRRGKQGISPWPTLELLLRFAPVLSDLGDRPRALALLTEARSILVASPDGAEAQFARLDRIERRLAGRPQSIALGAPLTEREAAVLRLLRGSLSLREIGQELYLSQNTIKTHTRAIYRKLGVSTRHDAIARGYDIDIF